MGPEPQTIEDWMKLWRRHCQGARQLLEGNSTALAWFNAGMAVECALKACIMAHLRLNRWPDRTLRKELHTHDLRKLALAAGVEIEKLSRDPVFPSWCTVHLWRRSEGYSSKPMPFRVARDMVEGACGLDGVIQWLMIRFRLDI
jgi:hypothetical protein